MNRAERRKNGIKSDTPYKSGPAYRPVFNSFYPESALISEYKRGFDDARKTIASSLIKEIYAAFALAAKREFKFGHDRLVRLLREADDILTMQLIDSDEAVEAVFNETGIKMDFKDGLERVKEVSA